MGKTICPITKELCYELNPVNNSDNEDDWIDCAFSEDGSCYVMYALRAIDKFSDTVFDSSILVAADVSVSGAINTYEQNL